MGAQLCSLRRSGSGRDQLPEDGDGPDEKKPIRPTSSVIVDLMKMDCLRSSGKRKELHQEKEREAKVAKVVEKVTLEDWLLASPAMIRRDVMNGREIQVIKQSSTRVCPWVRSPIEVEERAHQDQGLAPCLSRSQSRNMKGKRVSFRLPEEADIIIFWSPEYGVGE